MNTEARLCNLDPVCAPLKRTVRASAVCSLCSQGMCSTCAAQRFTCTGCEAVCCKGCESRNYMKCRNCGSNE